jgi:hypothetical protein
MTPWRKHPLSVAALLTAAALLQPVTALAAKPPPPKPGFLLGSHPSKDAKTARLALLKQRTTAVPLKSVHAPKIANSLNHRPGKIITVPRRSPK